MQRRNQDALIRIRTAVVNQEAALAEQMAQRKAYKPEDEHMALYQEDYKGTGGFAGADAKKRRGVSDPIFISLFYHYPFQLLLLSPEYPFIPLHTGLNTVVDAVSDPLHPHSFALPLPSLRAVNG